VTTDGLVYPLSDETLEPGSTRGVSNVFATESARVEVARGVVLAIRPGAVT
jgi:thiamine pyrophosphokinase